jgi:uncharacterized membrane protein YtjA (UPF0391 family)
MLHYAVVFFVIALLAAVLGLRGIAGLSAEIGWLFGVLGIVTLFGIVPSNQAKAAAEADAHKVSGVKQVMNELQVVPSAAQKAVKARDDVLQREVTQAFENREDLKDINVQVKNCVARLSGTVPGGIQRLEAAVVARSTQGASTNTSSSRLKRPAATASAQRK